MKFSVIVLGLLGAAAALALVLHTGLGPILAALRAAGPLGLLAVCAFQLGLTLVLAAAWRVLAPREPGVSFAAFAWSRLLRDAATEVLPFSPLGAIVIGVRGLTQQGVAAGLAFASLIMAITTEMAAQVVFTLAALALALVRLTPAGGATADPTLAPLIAPLAVGIVAGAATVAGFAFFQKRGLGWVERAAARRLPQAAAHAAAVRTALDDIHRRPGAILVSFLLHLAAWGLTAVAAWVGLRCLGAAPRLIDVIALEGLLYAIRSAAFFVPGALGVQEASYALIGPMFGVGADLALALSLLKRSRDVLLGAPTLLVWQAMEGRQWLRKGKVTPPAPSATHATQAHKPLPPA